MDRRSFEKGQLLLLVLRLLECRSMSGEEILIELTRQFGVEFDLTPGALLIGLAALEAEGLVEAETFTGATVYRITGVGIEAVRRRADTIVPARGNPAVGLGDSRERSSAPQIERAAILFTDVVGSTQLLDRLGDQAAHGVRRRHFGLLRRAVREHHGQEVKSLGDGLMVVFDDARTAIDCALSMQLAVASSDEPLELRIGVAWGETVREDGDYFGRPVILARRLCDAARGGDVIVPEQMRVFAESIAAELTPLGPLMLKGLSQPVTANVMRLPPLALTA